MGMDFNHIRWVADNGQEIFISTTLISSVDIYLNVLDMDISYLDQNLQLNLSSGIRGKSDFF